VRIGIGSDHAGYTYKQLIIAYLKEKGHDVQDFGTNSTEPVDYPLFIRPVAEAVATGDVDRGIVLGGSGNGEAIVANRVRGVRCALTWSVESAQLARHHNDANCISIGERLTDQSILLPIVEAWLTTPFDGGRHVQRIQQIDPGFAPSETQRLGHAMDA
jgi:ribose 5-phosphate isomerase B